MPAAASPTTELDRHVRRDLRTLARFVAVYCRGHNGEAVRSAVALRTVDVDGVCGRPVRLCATCGKLLAHAFVMRLHCPLDPKPACKRCPRHCYAPSYRAQMRAVMRYSGWRLVLSGRLDYLVRLLT